MNSLKKLNPILIKEWATHTEEEILMIITMVWGWVETLMIHMVEVEITTIMEEMILILI